MAPSYMGQSEPERKTWPNKLEYHLTLFSQALGLCSFWRFPYLAYENGGAPFLYAFLLLYLLVGVPLVFLEMAWGQYSNLAPIQSFSIIPMMQGLGSCMLLLTAAVVIYFGVASYYLLLYLVASFANPLPYSTCSNPWNTVHCQADLDPNCLEEGLKRTAVTEGEESTLIPKHSCNYTWDKTQTVPVIEFWQNNLASKAAVCRNLHSITDITMGSSTVLLLPTVVLGCFAAIRLIIATFSLASSVRFTGKVAYVLCTVPFAVSVMLLVRCITLENSIAGLSYLFIPSSIESFISPKVWKDAISQVFLSLLVTWGGLCTWSSYNKFYNRYEIDASILVTTVPIFSLLPSISVFGVIGHLSYVLGVPPSGVLNGTDGPLVPIVAYSEALSRMWGNPVPWSIIVFISLFVLSTASIFPCIECHLTSISDSFTIFRGLGLRIISVLILLFLTLAIYYGVPCIVEGSGLQYIEFFDTLTLPICCILVALPELLLITYAFGVKLLSTNIKAMTNNNCLKRLIWPIFWGGITPLILLVCLFYITYGAVTKGILSLTPTLHSGVSLMTVPTGWTRIATFVAIGVTILLYVITATLKILMSRGNCIEKLRDALTPASLGRSSIHTNGGGRSRRSNGDLFMADYVGHQDTNEILIDEDIVTTV